MNKRKAPAPGEGPTELIPQLLTVAQAAASLQVGRSTIYELMNREGLPYVTVAGMKRISVTSLHWWVQQRECGLHGRASAQPLPQATRKSNSSPVEAQRQKRRSVPKIAAQCDPSNS